MLGQRDAETLRVVEGAPHERAVLHTGAVVGEEGHAEGRQLAERGQGVAGASDGDGAGHRDLGGAADPERQHLGRHAGRIDRRLRVGHGHNGRVATERGGPGTGLDRLGLLATGLTQVGVQVDQPRADQAAAGVEHLRPARDLDGLGHRDDPRAGNGDVFAGQALGPDDGAAADDEGVLRQRPAPPRCPGARRRAARRGWPCARRHRWPPAG